MEKLLYGSLFTIITFIDLFLAYRCFKKQSAKGVPLGCCISCVAVISFLYMLCIMTENHQVMSISSSIYFCFIDLMLLFFLDFFLSLPPVRRFLQFTGGLSGFYGYGRFLIPSSFSPTPSITGRSDTRWRKVVRAPFRCGPLSRIFYTGFIYFYAICLLYTAFLC